MNKLVKNKSYKTLFCLHRFIRLLRKFFYLGKGQEAVLSQPVLAAYSIKQDGEGGAHQAAQGRQLPVLHVAAGIKIGSVTILNSKNLYCFNYKYLVAKIILLKFLI
jgi:hypothetical protein